MTGWPDSTNTGVPDGVTLLPSGNVVVTKPGTVISGLDIKGTVFIDADNVTIQNCRIASTSFSVVQIKAGRQGVVVQDCTIDGVGANNPGSSGITGAGTFLRNDISNVENGINVGPDRGTLIEGNYIHDLNASGSPHYDGIQIDGGQTDTIVRHNTVINDHTQTSAVMIDNYFGPVNNITVTDNLLVGGGYTVYSDGHFNSDPMSGVKITNNHIGGGYWGDLDSDGSNPTYTGNVRDAQTIASTLNGHGNVTTPPATTPVETVPAPAPTTSVATEGADHLVGDTKDNVLAGHGGNDVIEGGAGNDRIDGGAGYDTLTGNSGNDTFAFASVGDIGRDPGARDVITDFVHGQDKIDLSAIDANDRLSGLQHFTLLADDDASFTHTAGELAWHTDAAQNITLIQGDTNGDGVHDFEIELKGLVSLSSGDFSGLTTDSGSAPPPVQTPQPVNPALIELDGTSGADQLAAGPNATFIDGGAGNDSLIGGNGNDTILGGLGRDMLTGGNGDDIFLFKAAAETGTTGLTRDVITDFSQGHDRIDLSAIDASASLSGNQGFTFLPGDDQSFSHKAGELAWRIDESHDRTIIQGDLNGDGVHDFEIQLTGQVHLTSGDFIL